MCVCVLPGHMVDDGGEVGGSVELNRLQTLVVGFHHTFNTRTVRVLRVPVLHRVEKSIINLHDYVSDALSRKRLNDDLYIPVFCLENSDKN